MPDAALAKRLIGFRLSAGRHGDYITLNEAQAGLILNQLALDRPARAAGDEEAKLRTALQTALAGLDCALRHCGINKMVGTHVKCVKDAYEEASAVYNDEGTRHVPAEGAGRESDDDRRSRIIRERANEIARDYEP